MKRREFVTGIAAAAGATLLNSSASILNAATLKGIKAVAFDAFPIFDPRPIFANVEKLFPGKGTELSNQWRIRQFEYTWLRTIAGKYADFWSVTEDALKFAAKTSKIDVTAEQRKRTDGRIFESEGLARRAASSKDAEDRWSKTWISLELHIDDAAVFDSQRSTRWNVRLCY